MHRGRLFLIFVDHLQFASDVLDLTMFTNSKNLFYSQKEINAEILVDSELHEINQCFILISSRPRPKKNPRFSIDELKRMIAPYFLN